MATKKKKTEPKKKVIIKNDFEYVSILPSEKERGELETQLKEIASLILKGETEISRIKNAISENKRKYNSLNSEMNEGKTKRVEGKLHIYPDIMKKEFIHSGGISEGLEDADEDDLQLEIEEDGEEI